MREYLSDGHISVRKYRPGDAPALYESVHESISELTRWGFYHSDFSFADAEKDVISRMADWTEGKAFTYLVEMLPETLFLGNCSIAELDSAGNHAALGWWVRTSRSGQGIATATARLVAQAAFEDLHLRSLYIYTRVENTASRRVAEKIEAALLRIQTESDGSRSAVYELKPKFR